MSELISTGYTYDAGRIALNQSFSGTAVFSAITVTSIRTAGNNVNAINAFGMGDGVEASAAAAFAIGSATIASGIGSFAGGQATRATANYAFGFGSTVFATGLGSNAFGLNTSASGQYASARGTSTIASGINSMASGSGTTASGQSAMASGIKAIANNYAEWARSSGSIGQFGFLSYYGQTTNATVTEIYLNGGGATNERFYVHDNTAFYVRMTAIARNTITGAAAQWKGEGVVKNVSGIVSLVGTFEMNSTIADASFSAAGISVLSDEVNKALKVQVTGTTVGSDNINWFVTAQYDRAN